MREARTGVGRVDMGALRLGLVVVCGGAEKGENGWSGIGAVAVLLLTGFELELELKMSGLLM